MAVTAMLVGAWSDVLLVSRDPVARNLPLGPDQADPALADQAVQAVSSLSLVYEPQAPTTW